MWLLISVGHFGHVTILTRQVSEKPTKHYAEEINYGNYELTVYILS